MHDHVFSSLEAFPAEVLEKVVLALVEDNVVGPPTDLPAVLRISKAIYGKISFKTNPSLYSTIYVRKFDDGPAARRLGESCKHTAHRANELIKRFKSLKRIKYKSCRSLSARSDDIWAAYLLFLENEELNYQQLVNYACVDKFAFNFFKLGGPFHDGMDRNNGWRIDNEVNALVAWIFWFTDKDRAAGETYEDRQGILAIFSHMFVGSFKYASTHAPITSFCIPPTKMPLLLPSTPALPPSALPFSRPTSIKNYFGHEILITNPLLTPAALLICAVRLEMDAPETGNESLEGHPRPTTPFAEWGPGRGSEQYDHDWTRLITCYSPYHQPMTSRRVFTPGMLTGTWIGNFFEIPREQFDCVLYPWDSATLRGRSPHINAYLRHMHFHILEYHLHDRSNIIDYNDMSQDSIGEGVFNAWLPWGITLTEDRHDTTFFSGDQSFKTQFATHYHAYDPASAAIRELGHEYACTGPYGNGVYDIILTAKTWNGFAKDWDGKRYYGRVRDWDGLILLVSEATPREPSLIFSGYIHGNQNLVGRWREMDTPVDRPGWEGMWSMKKVT